MESSNVTFGTFTSGQLKLEPRADSKVSVQQCKITTGQYLQSITGFADLKLKSPFTSLNENKTF